MSKAKKSLLYVSLFSVSWAFHIILSRYALNVGLEPLLQQSSSLLISFIIFSVYYFLIVKKKITTIGKKDMTLAVVSGAFGAGIAGLLGLFGLNLSTSINYGFLIKTSAIFVILFSLPFLKEPIGKSKVLYMAILCLGTYLLSTSGRGLIFHYGDLLIVLSAVCIGASTVLMRFLGKRNMDPEFLTIIRVTSALFVIALAAFIIDGKVIEFKFLPLIVLISLLQVFMLSSWARTLSIASASYATMISMITPVIVVILAYSFFDEQMNVVQFIGGALVIFGGIMTQVKGVANHE